ncbi:MAG: ComF family protein [Phycisphaerales bacterium]
MADRRPNAPPFVWPPAKPRVRPGAPAAPPAIVRPSLRSRLGRLLLDLERDWLDPSVPALAQRMAAAEWAPDPPGAWCDRCGDTVGPHEADEFGCASCRAVKWPWDRFVRVGAYAAPLSGWVAEVKFTRFGALGVGLGRLLGEQVRAARPGPEPLMIVPVPSSLGRRVGRGIDHAGAIGLGAARALEAPLVRALGARRRPAQRRLPRSERARLTAAAFRPLEGVRPEGWTVVLVDDVRTTGATLASATRAIRRAWPGVASVWAASVAVTPEPSRRAGIGDEGALGGDSGGSGVGPQ